MGTTQFTASEYLADAKHFLSLWRATRHPDHRAAYLACVKLAKLAGGSNV